MNFNVDPSTGWITIQRELDRDAASIQDSGGVYAMYVKVGLQNKTTLHIPYCIYWGIIIVLGVSMIVDFLGHLY